MENSRKETEPLTILETISSGTSIVGVITCLVALPITILSIPVATVFSAVGSFMFLGSLITKSIV